MKYNDTKILGLMRRVNNSALIKTEAKDGVEAQDDSLHIKEYCAKVFGDGGQNPDPTLLSQFNNLIVQLADEVAKPKVTNMMEIFATTKSAAKGDLVKIQIPQEFKATVQWSANGSGVDMARVEGRKEMLAQPVTFSTGFQYEPLDLVKDSEVNFRALINKIADAKVDLYLEQITKLFDGAVTSGKIPANNVLSGSNLAIADYNKKASLLARYGGRPIFVADSLMIDHFAMQQATDSTIKGLLTEQIKADLLTNLNPSAIGRTTAVNLVNPFVDGANTKTALPVNVGYMFAGSSTKKPFSVVEYGGLRQLSQQNMEDERIQVKIYQDASVTMLFGENLVYVKDTSLAL